MNDSLKRPRARIDAQTSRLIAAAAKAAGELGINWMVAGAAGRTLLLESVYGLPHGHATQDVDLGVMVENWDQYQALIERLCEDSVFQPDPKQRQRLRFGRTGLLDLVPFGNIESVDRTVDWPPDHDTIMSVLGFRESYAAAVEVDVGGVIVRVVDPIGLMLLKLVAWAERRHTQPKKDAADMAYVLRHYSIILTEEVLFAQHFEALESASYDVEVAASRVLGQKMAAIAGDDTRTFIQSLLTDELIEEVDSTLVHEIAEHMAGVGEERTYLLLKGVRNGFAEGL